MRIAVFCPNLVGDTVMATPTFRTLRMSFPNARLIALIRPHLAPLLAGSNWFDEVIAADHRSARRSERTLALIRRLRGERPEIAVLLPNSFRVALTALLAGIPRRLGYVRYGRGPLLTDRLQPARDPSGRLLPTPIVESYLALARRLGCRPDSLRLELATTDEDEAAIDRVYAALGLACDEAVVVLNGGGAYGPAKDWPSESFAALARRLAREAGVFVLILCGPAERAAAARIEELAGHPRVVSLARWTPSLGLSKACLRRASLLVTTDSGPRHLATAFQTPVITLFGPTHIAWTRTYHSQGVHVVHPVECGPCQRRVCPQGHHRCMRGIDPDQVAALALRMLGSILAAEGGKARWAEHHGKRSSPEVSSPVGLAGSESWRRG